MLLKMVTATAFVLIALSQIASAYSYFLATDRPDLTNATLSNETSVNSTDQTGEHKDAVLMIFHAHFEQRPIEMDSLPSLLNETLSRVKLEQNLGSTFVNQTETDASKLGPNPYAASIQRPLANNTSLVKPLLGDKLAPLAAAANTSTASSASSTNSSLAHITTESTNEGHGITIDENAICLNTVEPIFILETDPTTVSSQVSSSNGTQSVQQSSLTEHVTTKPTESATAAQQDHSEKPLVVANETIVAVDGSKSTADLGRNVTDSPTEEYTTLSLDDL